MISPLFKNYCQAWLVNQKNCYYTEEMKSIFRFSSLSTLVVPALITLSCSPLSARKEPLSDQQENYLQSYQKAKSLELTDATGSCTLYSRLAKENFVLKNLALVRSHFLCANPKDLPPVTEAVLEQDPWLASLDLDRQLFEAQKSKEPKALSNALFKKAQKSDRIQEKVKLLQAAMEASKSIATPAPEDLSLQQDIQMRLYKLAPRLLPNPTSKDYLNVAQDLIFQREFSKGREFLNKIKKDSHSSIEEQYQARRAYRNSFKTEQKRDEHVVEAGKFAKWTEKHSSTARVHEAYVLWARAQWTQGDAGKARDILAQTEKILRKKKYPLDEVYFIRSRMEEEKHNLDEALEFLAKAEKESRPGSQVRGKILFSQAWMLRKKGQFQAAAEALQKLKTETQDVFDRNRYSFWLGKSLKQAEKLADASKEFQELTLADPLGYYGLVAYRELNTEIPALSIERKAASDEVRPNSVSKKDHELILALTFVDESEILGSYLDSKALDLRNQQTQEPATWLYYLKAYARAGLYNPLFQQMGSMPVEIKNQLLSQNPELLFPRKFLDLIQASAEKFGVRPELMLSIIRQESAFNPLARSGADALGLMQVMPSVAKLHQKKTGVSFDHFEDLYKPEVNIPIGASLLADLGKKYRGQFVLTAAAYNANEKAIQNWLKTRLQGDPLEFIEDIPYEETRAYVKLVLRNFIFYSRLASPGKTLAFPNWCLEDLQSFKVSTR
jgi:soluble lytic murein transglycosylase